MRKANSRIPASNQVFPNLNPNHALGETPKTKLFDLLREGLRSRQYNPRPEFRHGLFHITNLDLFKPENPSPLAGEGGVRGNRLFGGIHYSAISKESGKLKEKVTSDKILTNLVDEIISQFKT